MTIDDEEEEAINGSDYHIDCQVHPIAAHVITEDFPVKSAINR